MEKELTREEVIKGIEKYQELNSQNKLNTNREATKFVLVYLEENYPTKYILDLAYHIKHNLNSYDSQIYGGKDSRRILQNLDFEVINTEENDNLKKKEESMQKKQPLNQILYGPPGTGKTYNTINKALEIIDGEIPKNRKEAKEKFDKYRENGQIEFVTFHQSYGYEEFVEGIKADVDSDDIKYILEDGIFKALVNKDGFLDKLNIYISNLIDNSKLLHTTEGNQFTITISPNGGIKTNTKHSFSKEKLVEIYKGGKKNNPDYTYGQHIVNDINKISNISLKKYILIIDEINRGNISKIFGELITLIEPSKRIGEEEEIRITLANSKESFGVPSNLYIIGTMNTADRSIAQIDTALRRRFEFIEMMPKPELIVDENNNPIIIDGIEVQEVLKAINERIEYIYDREHTIGHSYFMPLIKTPKKDRRNKLDEIFRVNIIPLLAEYFYGDWADIKVVLNDKKDYFITKKETAEFILDKKKINNKIYVVNSLFAKETIGYKEIYKKAKTVKKDEE